MRIVDRGLVLLALRRSLAPGVVAWTICVLTFTLFAGSSGAIGTVDADARGSEISRTPRW